jgi:hypothetical protein
MIIKTSNKIPTASGLKPFEPQFNYIDSFSAQIVSSHNKIDAAQIVKLFFECGPKWVEVLLTIRHKMVKVFGLKTSGSVQQLPADFNYATIEVGQQAGLFKLFSKSDTEFILGEDDKHLNFRVSVMLMPLDTSSHHYQVIITTAVKFNNVGGRAYFIPVKPIHRLIVAGTIKGIVKKINFLESTL